MPQEGVLALHQSNRMAAPAEASSRAAVRALVVAQDDLRTGLTRILDAAGMAAEFAPDPYAAMGELCRRPLAYRAVVISLQGVYQEELKIVAVIKRRYPHVEVYLTHTDGRQGALAEGMRLGVDGIVSEAGVHRTATTLPAAPVVAVPAAAVPVVPPVQPVMRQVEPPVARLDLRGSEPVLTAEELRALLEDEPVGGEK